MPRPAALDTFLQRLAAPLGERLRTDAAAIEAVGADASHEPAGTAAAVLWPHTTAEVSAIAREAAALGVGLVPRGAGTGKAGGCIPAAGQVVVDLGGMNRLLQLRPQDLYAVVQPGLVTGALDAAAQQAGLMYPPDPGSWESCTLGGNISTNAGGPRAVKYGVTRAYVWGLEVVLAGGDVVRCGRRCIKGVAGMDLTPLFVGAEGTLGLITEATMHLVPAPRGVATAWLTYADPAAASAAASRIFAAGILPRMLELIDAVACQAIRPHGRFVPGAPGSGRAAGPSTACLLVEVDAPSDPQALEALTRLCEVAAADDTQVAGREADREAMRRARRLVSSSLKAQYPAKISDDIAVPRSQMPALLEAAQQAALGAQILASAYGHLGDGNLHLNLLCRDAEERQRAQPVRRHLWQFAIDHGGTVSGEHGIGTSKRDALLLEQPAVTRAWAARVKATFDPGGIMNPGKVYRAPKGAP